MSGMGLEPSTMPGDFFVTHNIVTVSHSGGVYEGEWHHNKKHGKGWYMSQTGVVTSGLFRDDQLVGEGLCRPVTPISRLTGGTCVAISSNAHMTSCNA